MSSRISRIQDYIHRILPQHTAGSLRLRGVWVPADPFMRGTARFARLSGAFLAVISSDNTMKLTARARQTSSTLIVDNLLKWIEPGVKLRIEGREVVTVEDADSETLAISLTTPLQEDHEANVSVVLYGVPVTINGDYPVDDTTFVIKTLYDIVPGDQLVVDTLEYDVIESLFGGTDPMTSENLWQITVSKGVHRALPDQGSLYLRGHPAYIRKRCAIPSIPALSRITAGPILLDRVSSTLLGEDTFDEICTVTLLGSNFSAIDDPTIIEKNFPVIKLSISPESMLFWTRANGKINWNGTSAVGYLVDDGTGLGVFRIVQKLEPPFPVGQITQWRMVVKPVAPVGAVATKMVLHVEPGSPQEFVLTNNVQATVQINFPSQDATRLKIAVSGEPGAKIEMGAWNVVGSQAKAIDYSIVCRTEGRYRWASSGILVKPYFLNLDYVRARFDGITTFGGGYMMVP